MRNAVRQRNCMRMLHNFVIVQIFRVQALRLVDCPILTQWRRYQFSLRAIIM